MVYQFKIIKRELELEEEYTHRGMKSYSNKKKGMQIPMICAFAVIFSMLYAIPWYWKVSLHPNCGVDEKLAWVLPLCMSPASALCSFIMWQAHFRASSPGDIDASLKKQTPEATVRQSIIQNTLEQALLAVVVYLCCAVKLPHERLFALPMAALMFLVGRIAFVVGYKHSSPGRCFGFTLTAMPTILLLAEVLLIVTWEYAQSLFD